MVASSPDRPVREHVGELGHGADQAQPADRELGAVDQQGALAGLGDHRALDLGLERVGVGHHAARGQALGAQEQPVGEVALDGADRERPDERARQPPQRAADADQLDVGPALVEHELHDREAVGQHGGGEPGLDDPARDEVARRRRVEEDRLARRHPRYGGLREPLLRLARDLQAAREGVLVRRRWWAGSRRRACGAPRRGARARRGRGARSSATRRSATRPPPPSPSRRCAAPRRSPGGGSPRAPSAAHVSASHRCAGPYQIRSHAAHGGFGFRTAKSATRLTGSARSVVIVFGRIGGGDRADRSKPARGRRRVSERSEPGPILELRDATKSYGAVRALRDGNLSLRPGEVRALIGENGAGKSTLVKVLGGVVRRDAGEMLVDGETVDFHSPHEARDAGIAVIYQEPTLFPDLSVAENVVMGFHPLRGAQAHRPRRHAPRGPGPARPPRRAPRPRAPGPRPLDRRPADRRDREGAELRRARPDHGRADRRAVRPRGRAAVLGRAHAARARRGACCSSRTASTRSPRSATPSR